MFVCFRDDVRSRLHQVLVFDTEVAQRYWIRHAQLIKLKQSTIKKMTTKVSNDNLLQALYNVTLVWDFFTL